MIHTIKIVVDQPIIVGTAGSQIDNMTKWQSSPASSSSSSPSPLSAHKLWKRKAFGCKKGKASINQDDTSVAASRRPLSHVSVVGGSGVESDTASSSSSSSSSSSPSCWSEEDKAQTMRLLEETLQNLQGKKLVDIQAMMKRNQRLVLARLDGGNPVATAVSMKHLLFYEAQREKVLQAIAQLQQLFKQASSLPTLSSSLCIPSPSNTAMLQPPVASFEYYRSAVNDILATPAPACSLDHVDDICEEARTRQNAIRLLRQQTKATAGCDLQ